MTIAADLSEENGQVDFASDVLKVKDAKADAVFMLIHEEETARFLKEAQKQGLNVPVMGDSMMLNPKVLELAGDAGVGARGFVGLTGDAPVKAMADMAARFKARFGYAPDHNGIQGYIAVYVVKAITTPYRQGRPQGLRRGAARRHHHRGAGARRAADHQLGQER